MSASTPTTAAEHRAPPLQVAVGVVVDDRDRVLTTLRAAHRHQGGLWEFPGGKIEVGESVAAALDREFREELGVGVARGDCSPLMRIRHRYADREVLLLVWRIRQVQGEPQSLEGQPLAWQPIAELEPGRFPAADVPIIRQLQWPRRLAITPPDQPMAELIPQLDTLRQRGIGWILLRRPGLDPTGLQQAFESLAGPCRAQGLCLSLAGDPALAVAWGADGVHLSARQLAALPRLPALPAELHVSGACHSLAELQWAEDLGLTSVLLSPVQPTRSHPEAAALGWAGFQALADQACLPVYALGGLEPGDLGHAVAHGAEGVAGISGFWNS